jgi:hypothetical protein
MPKSSRKRKRGLGDLWRRREELLAILLSDEPVLVGTVYDTLRRCGNPTCHCAERPSHRQTLLLFTWAGRRRCRFVRQGEAQSLRRAADRYRAWRLAFREFHTLQNRERVLLRGQIRKNAIRLE